MLKLPLGFIGHDVPKPANGVGKSAFKQVDGGRLYFAASQGAEDVRTPDLDAAIPYRSDRHTGRCSSVTFWASGRAGVVNLVAAHKWFNLAASKGRVDAVALRREVAELMSDAEIATAQREARAWMTAH
jgi:hypothetical protein